MIHGRDDAAIEVGRRLADRLDVTVLLTEPGDATPHYSNEFPIRKGSVRNGRGHLGQFELTIDDYAFSAPSSRRRLEFGVPHNGAVSTCDLALDLSGGSPMFPAHELRPGYLRADPRDRAAVEKLIADAGHLVGTLDKPRFIELDESLCAHSRSGITGCTRCLDLCPTGAIRLTLDSIQQNMVASTWVTPGCVQFLENQKRFHTAWTQSGLRHCEYYSRPDAVSRRWWGA